MAAKPLNWTEFQKLRAEELIALGLSRSAVAKQLHDEGVRPGCTKNAIIGIFASAQRKADQTEPRVRKPRAVKPKLQKLTPPLVLAPARIAGPAGVILLDDTLRELHAGAAVAVFEASPHSCHWSIGHSNKTDFKFCGDKTANGAVYCPTHARMAYATAGRK
jgi:GcrA cell cycle regulator